MKSLHSEHETPDLVGEELGDHARIWREYDRVAKADDQERIGHWNRGLDNLALFAGLFSAVTTAFIIQLQNDTRPDYAELTFRVLNATAAGKPFAQEAFAMDSTVQTTNCLWIASLMLSLTAALIAIMGKDWIGMYASRPACNPRQWAELRTYRLMCVERWYMPGVIASAPVLLHVSLILFATGLVLFFSPDGISQRVALSLSLVAGVFYSVTVLSGILFAASPFKSPATQAIRDALGSLLLWCSNTPWNRSPHAMRCRRAILLHVDLLPIYIISLDHTQRRMTCKWHHWRSRYVPLLPNWRNVQSHATALRETSVAFLRAVPEGLCAFRVLLQGRLRMLPLRVINGDAYAYVQGLRLSLVDDLLSTRWTNVTDEPTPLLLAQSLSILNDISRTPATLRLILMALGDLAIGRDVAPCVSSDLVVRLGDEIQQNWRTANIETFSRYVLTDRNLFCVPRIGYNDAMAVFLRAANDSSLRSENVLFAYSTLMKRLDYLDVALHCPVITTQPRGLRYLLPLLTGDSHLPPDLDALVFIGTRYWHYIHDAPALDFERELLRALGPQSKEYELYVQNKFSNQSGLLELLVFLLEKELCFHGLIYTLLIRLLASNYAYGTHPCLVYAFSRDHPAWTSLPWASGAPASLPHLLPLLRYRDFRWDCSNQPPAAVDECAFELSLARTVIGIMSAAHLPQARWCIFEDNDGSRYVSLELGMRCLHTQLCHPRSLQMPAAKAELIRLILEKHTLCYGSRFEDRHLLVGGKAPPERCVLNILTAIARHVSQLFARPDTRPTGAHLFTLFAFSETKDMSGEPIIWDLRAYLCGASARISDRGDDDPGADVSMCRLESAICALQPFCMPRDDLRAVWESIGLSADPYANDPYWDCDVGAFVALAEEHESRGSVEVGAARSVDEWPMAQATPQDYALLYLEGSMH